MGGRRRAAEKGGDRPAPHTDTQPAAPTRLEDLPPFLTVPEAAAILRLGKSAAYEAVTRGQIPAVRFGKKLRVPRAALLAFAREQFVSVPTGQAPDQQEPAGGVVKGGHAATDQP